ncbi:MAG: NADH:ubiquinone oxidoreductase subunit NDUFA12 [Rhodospirillaceae bacterium]|nr:NADH:ubiquinone oxidoreductase subunit NDUFA12 [Rhodospirillaceae bacterium]
MSIGTWLDTVLHGKLVGTDAEGNRYYEERRVPKGRRRRRWVVYKGAAEASRVPAEWHAWLHFTVDKPLTAAVRAPKPWQKPHQPNLTGTPAAYHPPGSVYEGGHRARATGDYEPWRPS